MMTELLQNLLDAGVLVQCDESSDGIEVKFEGCMTLFYEEMQRSTPERLYKLLRIRLLAHFDHAFDKIMNPGDK